MEIKNKFKEEFSSALTIMGEKVEQMGSWMMNAGNMNPGKSNNYHKTTFSKEEVLSKMEQGLSEEFSSFLNPDEIAEYSEKATQAALQNMEQEIKEAIEQKIEKNAHIIDKE